MATTESEGEGKQMVSFDGLRALLEKGCADLLGCIPTGDKPVINLALTSGSDVISMAVSDPHARLELLTDFAKAVRALAMGRSAEEVRRLMAEEGLAQRIVACDESWPQQYIV